MSNVTLPPTPAETSRPDWVIVGYRHRGKYVVLGSVEVTHAELVKELRMDEEDAGSFTRRFPMRRSAVTVVSAAMKRYVRAEAYSYGEALAILMATWDAEGHGPGELGR